MPATSDNRAPIPYVTTAHQPIMSRPLIQATNDWGKEKQVEAKEYI